MALSDADSEAGCEGDLDPCRDPPSHGDYGDPHEPPSEPKLGSKSSQWQLLRLGREPGIAHRERTDIDQPAHGVGERFP